MSGEVHEIGKTKDAGFQIGVRKTIFCSFQSAWGLITSPQGLAIWSGGGVLHEWVPGATIQYPDGTQGQVRVYKPGSHLRITWHPPQWARPSLIQVRVLDRGDRCVIAFHQEHLPDPASRKQQRDFFQQALAKLETMLQA